MDVIVGAATNWPHDIPKNLLRRYIPLYIYWLNFYIKSSVYNQNYKWINEFFKILLTSASLYVFKAYNLYSTGSEFLLNNGWMTLNILIWLTWVGKKRLNLAFKVNFKHEKASGFFWLFLFIEKYQNSRTIFPDFYQGHNWLPNTGWARIETFTSVFIDQLQSWEYFVF